jgi:hypothetical protein
MLVMRLQRPRYLGTLRFQPPDSSADKGALDKLPDRATGQPGQSALLKTLGQTFDGTQLPIANCVKCFALASHYLDGLADLPTLRVTQ